MKKKLLVIAVILFVVIGIYLNRSYSRIYAKIDLMALISPDKQHDYVVGKETESKTKYVALGDSLTAGVGVDDYTRSYPYLVAKELNKKEEKQVLLKTIATPGIRSGGFTDELLKQAIESKPDVITILLGVNDIHGLIPEKEFERNYDHILDVLTKGTKAKIYVINIPYIGSAKLILPPYNYYFRSQTEDFNIILKRLATKYKVNYIDIYQPTLSMSEKKDYYAEDLFHPSSVGYLLWAGIIYDNLNK